LKILIPILYLVTSDRPKTDWSVSAENEYSAQESKHCKNEEQIKNIGFWGCSCKFQVVANGQDQYAAPEKHRLKHKDKK
jgi:hypothetical protein